MFDDLTEGFAPGLTVLAGALTTTLLCTAAIEAAAAGLRATVVLDTDDTDAPRFFGSRFGAHPEALTARIAVTSGNGRTLAEIDAAHPVGVLLLDRSQIDRSPAAAAAEVTRRRCVMVAHALRKGADPVKPAIADVAGSHYWLDLADRALVSVATGDQLQLRWLKTRSAPGPDITARIDRTGARPAITSI